MGTLWNLVMGSKDSEQVGVSKRLLETAPEAAPAVVAVKVASPSRPLWEVLKVLVYCALYLSVGPTLILVNQSLLKKHKFNYPMMLSGLGLLFSALISTGLVGFGVVKLEHS